VKAAHALLALPLAASAFANPPVVIYQPAPATTVVSPLATSTAQSGQLLLNQITNTLQQRATTHQLLILQTQPVAQPSVFLPGPRAVRVK
jgi:hypothetical protein